MSYLHAVATMAQRAIFSSGTTCRHGSSYSEGGHTSQRWLQHYLPPHEVFGGVSLSPPCQGLVV